MPMTSHERLMAAYRKQEPDRVPVRVWAVDDRTQPIHPSYAPIVEAAREKTDLVGGWGGGPRREMLCRVTHEERPSRIAEFEERVTTIHTPAGPLTRVDVFNRSGKPGYCMKHLIESPEDAKRWLSIPFGPLQGEVSGFFERVREMGDRGVIMSGVSHPMYAVQDRLGPEGFAFWSIDERPLLHEMIQRELEMTLEYLRYILERGVGPLFAYVGPEVCIPPSQSVRDFEDFVVHYDRQWIELIHEFGGIVWCHCHGNTKAVLEGFIRAGNDVLQPLEPPPWGDIELRDIKRQVGRRMALEGNLEKHEMYTSTPSEIRERVRQAILDAGEGGGFVLCPSAGLQEWPTCDEQTVANFLAYIDAGREYGKYPLSREW
ncbi:MAG TPA: uroporphyrinogen decarboxylase family protein [Candidatus Latescibacteria bacterium]|nr:uroporphyrinogen decarboxylase family protein [Candidatus Latescibacterota bacterium]